MLLEFHSPLLAFPFKTRGVSGIYWDYMDSFDIAWYFIVIKLCNVFPASPSTCLYKM